jgi:hypothetical protein
MRVGVVDWLLLGMAVLVVAIGLVMNGPILRCLPGGVPCQFRFPIELAISAVVAVALLAVVVSRVAKRPK